MQTGRLNALFINDTSRNGGPGRTILDILKFLDPERVNRTVLVPREGVVSEMLRQSGAADRLLIEPGLIENPFEPFTRPMVRADFDATPPLKAIRAAGNAARASSALLRLARLVRREKFDVLFCNGTVANFLGGALGAMTATPAVWHVIYPDVAGIIRPLHLRLANAKAVRAIACVSAPTMRQFEGVTGGKVRLIHDALDIDEFDSRAVQPRLRAELGLDKRAVIFGSHGRVLRRKGFIELVRAARILLDRLHPDEAAHCRFVVVGDTPQDARPDHLEECRALASSLGLSEHVHFIGFRADVRPYVADFDVAVVPSIYEDPLPRSVMESMAQGKPVIAFNVGGIGEMIEDNVSGALVAGAPDNIDGLASACLAYFRDALLRLDHGAAARERIVHAFNARTHAKEIEDLLFAASDAEQ